MKKLFKLLINVIAVALVCMTCFGVVGCSKDDIKTVELKIQVYDIEEEVSSVNTLKVNLHRNLAPKTVDGLLNLVKEGYYNGTVFYALSGESSQIMLGDLKTDEQGNVLNNLAPQLPYSEFTYGGTQGGNLLNKEGSIGLWRSYYASDATGNTYKTSSEAMKSGRGTWYMPTADISSYDGYMCVFGQIDLENEDNVETIRLIKEVLTNTNGYTSYTIYYTGEYDAANPNAGDGNGLEFHCVKTSDFDEDTECFKAEGDQLVCYNKYTVKVPNVTASGNGMAKVIDAKII